MQAHQTLVIDPQEQPCPTDFCQGQQRQVAQLANARQSTAVPEIDIGNRPLPVV